MSRAAKVVTVFVVGCAMYLLEGCATVGWHRDIPNFRVQRVEWNVVASRDLLRAVCGQAPAWLGAACAVRIIEGGQCVVFSVYSQELARTVDLSASETLEGHELKHCGIGMPESGGWAHK